MSERFGPNFAPGSFALQQSIRLVYMLLASSRGRNRATRATKDNQEAHTPTEHTLGNGDNTTASPRLRRGAGRCCCCCCCCCAVAAAVLLLLHDPRCIAEHNPSQHTVPRFVYFLTHAGASNGTAAATAVATAAAQQQQQVQQQGRPKHTYGYRHQAG